MIFKLTFLVLAVLTQSAMCLPIDCEDIQRSGVNVTGVYIIYPERTSGMRVRCDMETTSGGWTVIQRRVSASENFSKGWNDYQIGFGELDSNFWLGNLQISTITRQNWYQLRVDMVHKNGTAAHATYDVFSIGDVESKYRLTVNGYHGTAGDSFLYHNGRQFSTIDSDNDDYKSSCATQFHGGFWYGSCHSVNLNGQYGNDAYAEGLTWHSFTGHYSSLATVDMKLKRFNPSAN